MDERIGFKRVEPDDPNRCQAVHASQQCPFRATGTYDPVTEKWDGPKYCPRHGGYTQQTLSRRRELEMYNLAKWRDRIKHQADHPRIKTLTNEVAIIRMTLEARLNSIHDDRELIMASSGLVALTNNIKDLLKTAQHLEERSGQVIDRAKMMVFIQNLVEILTRYIPDPEILQMVGEDISEMFEQLLTNPNHSFPTDGNHERSSIGTEPRALEQSH